MRHVFTLYTEILIHISAALTGTYCKHMATLNDGSNNI